VWAVDFSAGMLAALPAARVTPVEADAARVDLGRRFPVIVSAGMLEFVPDPAAVLANAARHAERNGRFVLLVPRRNLPGHCYRALHRGHGISIAFFDRQWFEAAARASGWRLVETRKVFPFALVVALELA
jgi:SAM-dependent methyltransferase